MIARADPERIKNLASRHGFVLGGETKAWNAGHLIFSGEGARPPQTVPNPPIHPEYLSGHDVQVAVIPVADLAQLKLSNNRDIDSVPIRDLDAVGLIRSLLPVLRARLQEIRETE
jgi:hypothetical protein